MDFVLGWRYEASVEPMREALDALGLRRAHFSGVRTVRLASFEMARTSLPIEELLGDPYDWPEEWCDLSAVCDAVDATLLSRGLRLATEDEFEAACGGDLFAWGMDVPDGIPYGRQTAFSGHQKENAFGLFLNSDPYTPELTRIALNLGDGGGAICDGLAWPAAWLTLAPSFRQADDAIEYFTEMMETVRVRPVRT